MSPFPVVPLVGLLRAELSGYGGLLALFDRQQAQLWRREIGPVADTSLAIETLAAEVAGHRAARETWVAGFAGEHARPADSTLRNLLPLFPADQQSLLAALIEEINHLLHRVRRRARQNHTILSRAVELHRDTLALLIPGHQPRTYAPSGQVAASTGSALAFRAAG